MAPPHGGDLRLRCGAAGGCGDPVRSPVHTQGGSRPGRGPGGRRPDGPPRKDFAPATSPIGRGAFTGRPGPGWRPSWAATRPADSPGRRVHRLDEVTVEARLLRLPPVLLLALPV